MAEFQPTPHPLLPEPTVEEALAMGPDAWIKLMIEREEIIQREVNDPFRHGYEPFVWKMSWAIMGVPWVPADEAAYIRRVLGFEKPRRVILVNGGNRGSKTEWAAKTVMRQLHWKPNQRLWCFHQSRSNSVELQQKLMFRMLPPELRKEDIRTPTTYIKFSIQNGFTGDRFVLPNLSECGFRNYEQDKKEIEGGEQDGIWCDEHVPGDWLETLKSRIATRGGWLIVTCTPTEGYSPVVKMFEDGAETLLQQPALLLPRDGQEPDEAQAFDYQALEKMVSGMKN